MRRFASPARIVLLSCGLAAAAFLTACLAPPEATVPIPARFVDHPGGNARELIIFLPGRGDSAENFVAKGLLDAAWQQGWQADALLVEAHLGYYYSRTLSERLRTDVWPQVDARGYHRVWLAGISLGGLGSIFTARDNPGRFDGIIAVAPFLGDKKQLFAELTDDGPAQWQPAEPIKADDFQRQLWLYLRGYGDPSATRPPLWLAYGEEDDFAPWLELLAALLPAERTLTRSGGHLWTVWRPLWDDLLAQRPWEWVPLPAE